MFLRKPEVFAVLSEISNTLSDDNFYDAIIETPGISLKDTQLRGNKGIESKTLPKGSLKSVKELSMEWYI